MRSACCASSSEFRRASEGVEPVGTGARSRTESGVEPSMATRSSIAALLTQTRQAARQTVRDTGERAPGRPVPQRPPGGGVFLSALSAEAVVRYDPGGKEREACNHDDGRNGRIGPARGAVHDGAAPDRSEEHGEPD